MGVTTSFYEVEQRSGGWCVVRAASLSGAQLAPPPIDHLQRNKQPVPTSLDKALSGAVWSYVFVDTQTQPRTVYQVVLRGNVRTIRKHIRVCCVRHAEKGRAHLNARARARRDFWGADGVRFFGMASVDGALAVPVAEWLDEE